MGHQKGIEAAVEVVQFCREKGIQYVTLYAFSIENWRRPQEEIRALMGLLEQNLRVELAKLLENNIRLMTIGNIDDLPLPVVDVLEDAKERTKSCDGMVLNLALSYGGRDEIVLAVRKLIRDVKNKILSEDDINETLFSNYLFTKEIPDPDLLIRTSGEMRISNFLLWQLAYTEIYVTNVLWPDFTREDMIAALAEYQRRERRFGRTSEQLLETAH